jgi:hypothetical protein
LDLIKNGNEEFKSLAREYNVIENAVLRNQNLKFELKINFSLFFVFVSIITVLNVNNKKIYIYYSFVTQFWI